MKKTFIVLLSIAFLGIVLIGCKKNNVPSLANETIVSDSTLYVGQLTGGELGDISRGDVSIEKSAGKKFLVFKNFTSSNGPAVYVYLSKTIGSNANPPAEYIDLGLLKATNGSFNYEVTSNPDITTYKYALVWCRQFRIQFGYAELKR